MGLRHSRNSLHRIRTHRIPRQNMYDPVCGTACIRSFYIMMLNCSSEGEMIGMVHLMTSTECYAENTAYLTSVAWCTNAHCEDEKPPAGLLEY